MSQPSNPQIRRCADYQNLSVNEDKATAQLCQSDEIEERIFTSGKPCSLEDTLGGCRQRITNIVAVVTWIYGTGDTEADITLLDVARETCLKPTKQGDVGVWLEGESADLVPAEQ